MYIQLVTPPPHNRTDTSVFSSNPVDFDRGCGSQ